MTNLIKWNQTYNTLKHNDSITCYDVRGGDRVRLAASRLHAKLRYKENTQNLCLVSNQIHPRTEPLHLPVTLFSGSASSLCLEMDCPLKPPHPTQTSGPPHQPRTLVHPSGLLYWWGTVGQRHGVQRRLFIWVWKQLLLVTEDRRRRGGRMNYSLQRHRQDKVYSCTEGCKYYPVEGRRFWR